MRPVVGCEGLAQQDGGVCAHRICVAGCEQGVRGKVGACTKGGARHGDVGVMEPHVAVTWRQGHVRCGHKTRVSW